MPSKRRRQIIDRNRVGAYHCFSRCVRRAFLAGRDGKSRKDYSYRKEWVRKRLEDLASVFLVDVLDHAVMDNHIHTIVRNRPDLAKKLKRREVARRWLRLSRKQLELREPPTDEEIDELLADKVRMRKLRRRLSDISWFMLMLNEPIALKANIEDDMSGHFWAERFGSVQLKNEEALLACSLYVDLNPIRAGQAESPEDSTFTAACDRLRDWREEQGEDSDSEESERTCGIKSVMRGERRTKRKGVISKHTPRRVRSGWLSPLRVEGDGYEGAAAGRRASDLGYLPMTLEKYLLLLDACGREKAAGKRGQIPEEMPSIIDRLGLDPTRWTDEVMEAAKRFARIAVQCARQTAERRAGRKRK